MGVSYFSLHVWRLVLFIFLPVFAVAVAGAVVTNDKLATSRINEISAAERAVVERGKSAIGATTHDLVSDMAYIRNHAQRILSEFNTFENSARHMRADFFDFAQAKQKFDQVRVLSAQGRELIRTNFADGRAHTVPDASLQDKSGRYYFKESIRLSAGEIYTSPLDLNVEKGQIEFPLKPMLRLGTPIFDKDGNKFGVVILNYLAAQMVRVFEKATRSHTNKPWLVNANGYWLKGPDANAEWGFMYPEEVAKSLRKQYAESWAKIGSKQEGQFSDAHGLWTFNTVYPLDSWDRFTDKRVSDDVFLRAHSSSKELNWKVISLVKAGDLGKVRNAVHELVTISVVVFLLMTLIGSWLLAVAIRKEQASKQSLVRANNSLELAASAKNEFLANMSHELRTPLNAIIGFSDLLMLNKDSTTISETEMNNISHINKSGTHLLEVIDEILDLSASDTGSLVLQESPLDLQALFASAVSHFHPDETVRKLTVRNNIADTFPIMTGDQKRIQQVATNLVSNAVRYSPKGAFIDINATLTDSHGIITVSNSGVELTPEQIDFIMAPFTRLNSAYSSQQGSGSGLGLPFAKKIIQAHNGILELISEKDKGVTAKITFPRSRFAAG